ncbi:MAG: hypothetical protein WCP21_18870, partial [Armatimonadota bacterium]
MRNLRLGLPLALLLFAVPLLAQTAPPVLFEDTFEQDKPAGWDVQVSNTIATLTSVAPGQLSPRCLELSMPDFGGMLTLQRSLPVPADHWVVLTMGLQSVRLQPYAEYYIWFFQNDAAGKAVGAGEGLAFNDGLARASDFGGQFKAPQTFGEWKTTRHVIHLRPGAVSLDVRIVFRGGGQVARLDNFRLEDAGTTEPQRETPAVYAADLTGGVALLDLDVLTPTLTYELTVTTGSADHRGMGARMATVDLHGQATQPLELPGVVERGNDLVYRFAVPAEAVRTRFDLYSDDLMTKGPYHNEKYRQFTRVVVRLVGTRPAEDTMMYNFEQGMVDK